MVQHGLLDQNKVSEALADVKYQQLMYNHKPSATVTKLDVVKIKRALEKWVVLPLDKDAGSTGLMCPHLFWHRRAKCPPICPNSKKQAT